jgi:flagellar biosynthetic protein FliS
MRYLEASIETLSKEDLLVKIFDAIVLFTRKAVEKMKTEPNDIQGRHNALRTAQKACAAAIDAIDFELGGELAQSNAALYQFWYRELVATNMEGDVKRAEGLLPQMLIMRNAWAEAVRTYKKEMAGDEPRQNVAVV